MNFGALYIAQLPLVYDLPSRNGLRAFATALENFAESKSTDEFKTRYEAMRTEAANLARALHEGLEETWRVSPPRPSN
jgi:hypothetical protein